MKYCTYDDGEIHEETFEEPIVGKSEYMGHPGGHAQIGEFIECVRDGREPFCSGETSLNSMAVSFAAEESVKTGVYVSI